ncbi:MAG: TetR/AcrR family transcriptional regulator [Phenylobacterium sp.]|uniref:TetR/AcrR family transcriptional regulator n=1 Tax=Phenylobacterium sp. TaxID=1871053 RepID=UPI0027353D1C|nr:TetR/AcrR family transcriptional regulator [Phenylobacterium sp.]MDP3747750.1 TetR/AcrR family transcriptional regulator [Phenylobacterium sp.]
MKTGPALVKDTRARILEAALELFAEHGFAGTSVRRLAREVGLRESSLYNHFAGKEAIYHALIDAYGPASSADRLRGPRYAEVKDDPAGFCRLYVEDLLDQWSDPREQRFQELILAERNRFEGERAHYVEALFSDELGVVTRYFSGFAQGGQITAANPGETARLFMAGLTFIRLEHYIMPAKASLRARVRAALDRFLDTFLALVARSQPGDAHEPATARRS